MLSIGEFLGLMRSRQLEKRSMARCTAKSLERGQAPWQEPALYELSYYLHHWDIWSFPNDQRCEGRLTHNYDASWASTFSLSRYILTIQCNVREMWNFIKRAAKNYSIKFLAFSSLIVSNFFRRNYLLLWRTWIVEWIIMNSSSLQLFSHAVSLIQS